MTSVVELFAYQMTLNISTRKTVRKILPKKLYCHFDCNAIKKCWTKFHFINTLKYLLLLRVMIACMYETLIQGMISSKHA